MSRAEYSDDLDQWDLIRWRGAVASAIKGKRGQALLKELETALLAMPEKKLCRNSYANSESGEVCALGAVAVKRLTDQGESLKAALELVEEEHPEGEAAEQVAAEMGVAAALVREITYVNDERGPYEQTNEMRYQRVLEWVQENIAKTNSSGSSK